MYVYFP